MEVSLERVERAAPDQASLTAARKLLKPAQWPELGIDAAGGLLWGACQGSGAQPYRMAVALHDLGAKCSCPSRKFPCKHSLALLWWRATEPGRFVVGETPEWVRDWLGRRRGSAVKPAAQEGAEAPPPPPKSLAAAERAAAVDVETPRDGESAAKQRERNRVARERSVAAGLDELDQWLADQLEAGFGAFAARAGEQCRTISRRLADAKAPGLATRVEQLAADFFATPEAERDDLGLRGFADLHLLAEAYRRQDRLPADLRADLRRQVGWSQTRAELLEDATVLRVAGDWVVLGHARTVEPGRLVRFETFLAAADPASPTRHAVLVDHVPAASATGHLPPGDVGSVLDATLVFYPSSVPWRALVAELRASGGTVDPVPGATVGLDAALAEVADRAARLPWWDRLPLAARGAVRREVDGDGLWWVDGDVGLPLDAAYAEVCAPLTALPELELHALFDGRRLTPLAARTGLGPWWNEAL